MRLNELHSILGKLLEKHGDKHVIFSDIEREIYFNPSIEMMCPKKAYIYKEAINSNYPGDMDVFWFKHEAKDCDLKPCDLDKAIIFGIPEFK